MGYRLSCLDEPPFSWRCQKPTLTDLVIHYRLESCIIAKLEEKLKFQGKKHSKTRAGEEQVQSVGLFVKEEGVVGFLDLEDNSYTWWKPLEIGTDQRWIPLDPEARKHFKVSLVSRRFPLDLRIFEESEE